MPKLRNWIQHQDKLRSEFVKIYGVFTEAGFAQWLASLPREATINPYKPRSDTLSMSDHQNIRKTKILHTCSDCGSNYATQKSFVSLTKLINICSNCKKKRTK